MGKKSDPGKERFQALCLSDFKRFYSAGVHTIHDLLSPKQLALRSSLQPRCRHISNHLSAKNPYNGHVLSSSLTKAAHQGKILY